MGFSRDVVIRNSLEELEKAMAMLAEFVVGAELPGGLQGTLELVLEEMIINTISYAYEKDEEDRQIQISIAALPAQVEVRLVDDGKAFDPFTDAPLPDLDAPLEDRRVGGLGVHFVRELMDKVSYERRGDENHVLLVKKLQS